MPKKMKRNVIPKKHSLAWYKKRDWFWRISTGNRNPSEAYENNRDSDENWSEEELAESVKYNNGD